MRQNASREADIGVERESRETFGDLLTRLATASAGLVRDEIDLAKQEMREKIKSFRTGIVLVSIAALFGIIAIFTLDAALVIGIGKVIGAKSLLLVSLAGSAIGVVISIQTYSSFVRFGAKSMIPVLIVLSIIRESGPIVTALIFAGRVGAGIGAELGSMRVTEQIDAMEASAVDTYKFLAGTRVLACVLMLPLLTIVTDGSGILMGWVANTLTEPVSLKLFLDRGFANVDFGDLLPSIFRTAIFGMIIGAVSSYQGMRAQGGTEGVGRAATSSVVLSSLLVILADVLLVRVTVTFFG